MAAYLERLQISEQCYVCVNKSLVCHIQPASSYLASQLTIVNLDMGELVNKPE